MPTTPLPYVALAALLLVAPLAQAQQAPKAPGKATPPAAPGLPQAPPPPPAGGPGPKGPAGPHGPAPKASVQALSDFSGTIGEYQASGDEQVYDAFTLKTSTGTETVRFPRHLGQALLAAAKPGSPVTVTGFRDADPQGRATLHLVSAAAGSQTVRDTPPARPATPPTEETTTVRGTVQRLAQGPRGETNAAILADGTILRLPPNAATQLADKLKAGATIAATGTLRTPAPGEVAARPVRVVRPQTLTLDGVQFLVR